ncbi:MAG: YlmC/YmxH family sporulation protein [Clostridia bacterium]|nr:YlmC/YmxH family sporulation protein [Clostridia bacterium]MDD6041419.1 YlmC/YmxH family sporulation protein [Clostridia bacterium]
MTLSELRTKEVIDVQDGKRLGRVMDLEFCPTDSRITALVVPAETSFLQTLRGEKCGMVIPWQNIRRIGDDVILVSTADLNCGAPPTWANGCPPC